MTINYDDQLWNKEFNNYEKYLLVFTKESQSMAANMP